LSSKASSRMSTAISLLDPTSAIRRPSRHTPGSAPGCVIFVKLWQFDPEDRTQIRIDTDAMSYTPAPSRPGVELKPLFLDSREDVRLERWASGATVALDVPGGAKVLVLDGGFDEGGDHFEPQSWLRLPPGRVLQATAGPEGCKAWVKTGHLLHIEGVNRS